jgi:hypothetical protein
MSQITRVDASGSVNWSRARGGNGRMYAVVQCMGVGVWDML